MLPATGSLVHDALERCWTECDRKTSVESVSDQEMEATHGAEHSPVGDGDKAIFLLHLQQLPVGMVAASQQLLLRWRRLEIMTPFGGVRSDRSDQGRRCIGAAGDESHWIAIDSEATERR
jgi:hypothetical protein